MVRAAVATLPEGLEVRTATAGDEEQIVALSVAVHGPVEEAGVLALLEPGSVGIDRWTVVVDGDRVVSTLCLMSHRFRYGPVTFPVGQVEYVATAEPYRDRGLIRAQMDVVHRWSAERGDLATVIEGIPYFYRRFGYEYGLSYQRELAVAPGAVAAPPGWDVEPMSGGDVPAVRRLHEAALGAAELAKLRTDEEWGWLLDIGPASEEEPIVARHQGEVRAFGRWCTSYGRRLLRDVAADSADGVRALLASVSADGPVRVLDRPGTVVAVVADSHGQPASRGQGLYVRVPDLLALLTELRPLLSARLAASALAGEEGRLVVSLFRSAVALTYEQGQVTGVATAAPDPDPEESGAVGVPPDLVATLVFGRHGALELERHHDDVHLGRERGLMAVLFPPVTSDLLAGL